MPAPVTTDDFLKIARQSGIVEPKDLDGYLSARAAPLPASPTDLARAMVRDGLLTGFQAGQFLKGKWRGFLIAGKYKLLEHVGTGGMASVFLCEHVSMHRRVAIKVLPAAQANDPGAVERFYREARAVATLDHPNLVRAHDIDRDGKAHFLVMEYVDGSSLQDIVKKRGPLSVERASHYIRQAAVGLDAAHAAGLVHRDIKPGNILVDRSGTVKILDMGLARFFHDEGESITKKFDENCVLGTADYCAPEQALNSHAVDIRADIYSLGATFYYCLTGQTPFGQGTTAQKIIWHQMKEPTPVRELRPEVPQGLADVIARMMAKAPEDRYQTPAEVEEALARWDTEDVPPPPEEEMPRLCPRSQGPGSTDPSTGRRPMSSTTRSARIRKSGAPASDRERTTITKRPSGVRAALGKALQKPNVPLLVGAGAGALLLLLLIVVGAWWVLHDRTPSPAGPPAIPGGPRVDGAVVGPLGIFEDQGNVGTVPHAGSVAFDPAARTYTVTGGGANMGPGSDAFHYVWKKAYGDVALTADIAFAGAGQGPQRQASLVIRQGTGADAAYVAAALRADGLTALQFREDRGGATRQVQANVSAPGRLRIEKRGKYALLYLAGKGEEPCFSGAAVRLPFEEPFYVGLGVCAGSKDATEQAVFSNVDFSTALSARRPVLYSSLETLAIDSKDRRVVHVTPTRLLSPNWLPDGQSLLFSGDGRLHRIPVAGGRPEALDTGFAAKCNSDHGYSPNGALLAFGDESQGDRTALIYTMPVAGGMPKLVTPAGPSYFHGWSPDGKIIVYCGQRDGEYDVYSIPAGGGEETRLTTAQGTDDGPEFAPDGQHIYFNSERTGHMQIWRMRPDGSEQEQVTHDEYGNWFPHFSPDGRHLVMLSYEKGVPGHPENRDVTLRLMSLADRRVEPLARIMGGLGTINAPCWSPDGRHIAFVSYQLIP
jgi:serine/threonine protein kinase